MSAFFSWANREFNFPSPMKMVPRPKFEVALIEPFTKEEIEVLLTVCDYSHEAKTDRRRKFVMRRFTAYRDRAVILFLLDTGLRSSELCALKIGDVDQKTGKVTIKHGATGGAKGKKGRVVYMGKSTRRALWRYLATREDADDSETSLFLGKFYRPLNKGVLRQLLARLGDKAKVVKVHPHRFRHTFAITYLRSNGDLFTLKALLGHSSLDMVQHYARIAQVDIEAAHRRASPADNWHL